MDAQRQAYWWWFDSHNTPKYSPWLRSTLAELDEKTKAMLKLIEEDADSFAQRAEMYYQKRPELIGMVEDFYRAYRSLAERYDQHRMDPVNRVRSPLRHSMPEFKPELGLKSINSFGSLTEDAYNSSAESAESEIDDPEEDHDIVVVGVEDEIENQFGGGSNYDELMELRDVDRLREENEIQRNLIKQKDKETDKLKNEMESLKSENMNLKKEMVRKEEAKNEMERKLDEVKSKLMKMRKETKAENAYMLDALAEKDEEKREVIRQLSIGMEMLREENQLLKKSIMNDTPNKRGSPEFHIFKGFGLGNLFGLSTSVLPL